MQQVQGFSRLQTVPSGPATAPRPKLWILSSWRDLVLYVGTPLRLIPPLAVAQGEWTPRAGHDPRVRRWGFVRTLSVALHFRAAVSARNLYRFLLVGSEGNFANRFLLGRLARVDADLRVLPHLRRQNGHAR